MLLIDLVILAAALVGVALIAGRVVGRRVDASLEERRRREQGERNAAAERRRLAESCVVCGKPIDANVDLWERNEWWHRDCWREQVGEQS